MLTSVGSEQEGHEVLVVTFVVDLAISNDILGKISDCVSYRNLGLKDGKREGSDRREQPKHEHGDESRVCAAHVLLGSPKAGNFNGIGSPTDGVEVVSKSDAADDVHGGAGSIVKNVDLDGRLARGMDLVHNAGLEGGGDEIDVGVHFADVVRREGRGKETTHALMLLLTLDPDERAATNAKDKRTEGGGMMVIVCVLCVYVGNTPSITHNQLQYY